VIEVVLPSGFVKCVRSVGLALPDDISVIGFDGIEFAEFVEPTLTTFRQPRRELGYRGASLLVSAMRGEATTTMSTPIPSSGPSPPSTKRHSNRVSLFSDSGY
jgi:DNA-binding LacI/PurR family transcriptional regulator